MFRSVHFIVVGLVLLLLVCDRTFGGSMPNLSQKEQVVAITILAEARGEGLVGMQAVACVIQQRSIERRINVADVCLEEKQFSCWNDADSVEALSKQSTRKTRQCVVDQAVQLAKDLVAGKQLDRAAIGYANHYHTLTVHPKWSRNRKPVAIIGHHMFFKL